MKPHRSSKACVPSSSMAGLTMKDAIKAGPDGLVIGHRRLSIIDILQWRSPADAI
jgi:hypothetical protein